MYCKYCGKEIPQNLHSCPNCEKNEGFNSLTFDIHNSPGNDINKGMSIVSFFRNNGSKILLGIAVLISLFLSHIILTYFFGDYYNPTNYNNIEYVDGRDKELEYNDNESYIKKANIIDNSPEHFYAEGIGTKVPDGEVSTSTFKYSSNVKFISKYFKDGFDGYGYYYYSISTFDISEMMKEYSGDEGNGYNTILEKLYLTLKTEPYDAQYTTIDGNKALVLYTNDEQTTKRLITCANKRLYFIETHTSHNLEHYFNKYCSQFRFKLINPAKNLFLLFSSLITTFIFILSVNLYLNRRKLMKNRFAFSLFVVSVVSFITNMAIAIYQAYVLYFTSLSANNMSVYVLAGALLTAVCVAMPLTVFYIKTSKQNWNRDYIVPSFLRTIHYNRLKNDMQRGTYTSYVCYPLMVLSLLPFGIYFVTLYCVPLLITCSIIVSYQKWRSWVKGSI